MRLKLLIFRRSRGNAITIIKNIEQGIETLLNIEQGKSMYIVAFQGNEQLKAAIMRVCELFSEEM